MRTGKGEAGVVVIERCRVPGGCAVANVALLREPDRSVVRVIGVRVVGEMARHACRVCQSIGIATGMALAALQRRVRPGQGPAGRGMIEGRLSPRSCVVTDLALLREAYRHVIRVGRAGEILLMAAVAGRWQAGVIVVYVALRALNARVRAGEWKRRLGMIERCRHPRRGGVADLAGLRDPGGRVVRIGRGLVIPQVARDARGRSEIEVPICVALIALQVGMATS